MPLKVNIIKTFNQEKKQWGQKFMQHYIEAYILNKGSLHTQADAVIYFFQRLDIDMVSDILEDNRTYQDFEKLLFNHKLGNAFEEFVKAGNILYNATVDIVIQKL